MESQSQIVGFIGFIGTRLEMEDLIYEPDEYNTPNIKLILEYRIHMDHLKPGKLIIYNDHADFKYRRWEFLDIDIPCIRQLMVILKNLFFIMPLYIATTLTGEVSEASRQRHKLEILIRRLDEINIEPEPEVPLYAMRRQFYIHDRFEPFLTSAYDFRSVINDIKTIIINLIQIDVDIDDVVIKLCTVVDIINYYDKQMRVLIRHYEDFYICIRMLRDIYEYSRSQRNERLNVLENNAVIGIKENLLFMSEKLYVPFNNNDVLLFAS